jgi:hypothetical protein
MDVKTKVNKALKRASFVSVLVFTLLLSLFSVSGAYFDYNVDFHLDSNTRNNEIGDITIQKTNYVPQLIDISIPKPLNLDRNDVLRWNGVTKLFINNSYGPVTELNNGESYTFSIDGDYIISNGASQYGVHVAIEPSFAVQLDVSSEDIEFDYDADSYTISSQKAFDIEIRDLPNDAKTYDYTITVNDGVLNKSFDRTIVMDEIRNWTITNHTISNITELKSGDYLNIGLVQIENKGNAGYKIQTSVEGNVSSYINIQEEYTLAKGGEVYINVLAQIPSLEEDKTLSGNLIIKNIEKEEKIPFSIVIKDLQDPTIKNVSFEHDYLVKSNLITLDAMDNIDVEKVFMTENGKKYEFEKDQQLFVLNHTFNESKKYKLSFCAYDRANNSDCIMQDKEFDVLDLVSKLNNYELNTAKYNNFMKQFLFNVTEEANEELGTLDITLKQFTTNVETIDFTDFNIRLVTPSEEIIKLHLNQTINLFEKGEYMIELKSNNMSEYEGMIEFDTPYYSTSEKNMFFKGKISDYETPENIQMEWYNRELTCRAMDTGIIETSKYDCEISLPIDVDFDSMILPVTMEEKELSEKEFDDLTAEKNSLITWFTFIGICFIVVLFVVVLYAWLVINVGNNIIYIGDKK